jgi:hypothetical protein
MTLNLTATKTEEIIIKDYLENNVSDTLAEKINNGVRIEKDGKTLTNKKTLTTFMNYACEEAKKQADKGARFACIGNDTVFGWAVHYFEEDEIEGTLYNEDGTEYKTVKPAAASPVTAKPPKPEPMSFFDIVDNKKTDTAGNAKTDDDFDDIFDMDMPTVIQKPTVQNEPKPAQNAAAEIPSFIINLFGDDLKIEVG